MISLLLALLNFVVTVALHVLEISVKVALQVLKIGAKVSSKVVKTTVKEGKKVAKKTATEGKKVAKKATNKGKQVVKNALETKDEQPSEEEKVREQLNINKDEEYSDEDKKGIKNSKVLGILKKFAALKLVKKAVHTALLVSRMSLIFFVVYIFVLASLVVTGTLALTASAGYVALAYDNGNFGTSDNSFDITEDTKKTKEEENGSANFVKGDTSTISGKLEIMANWYTNHVATYAGTYHKRGKTPTKEGDAYYAKYKNTDKIINGMYYCDLIDTKVRDDCTGFAMAFANYVSGTNKISISYSGAMVTGWNATKYGWTYYETKDLKSIDDLQTGDILVSSPGSSSKGGTLSSGGYGHAEVYVDNSNTFGWGSIKNKYPTNNKLKFEKNSQGRNVVTDSCHMYVCFYRYTGK